MIRKRKSHFYFKGFWVIYFYILIQILIENSVNSGDNAQTPHSVASGLSLHCLPMSNQRGIRYIWLISSGHQVQLEVECLSPKL